MPSFRIAGRGGRARLAHQMRFGSMGMGGFGGGANIFQAGSMDVEEEEEGEGEGEGGQSPGGVDDEAILPLVGLGFSPAAARLAFRSVGCLDATMGAAWLLDEANMEVFNATRIYMQYIYIYIYYSTEEPLCVYRPPRLFKCARERELSLSRTGHCES